MNSILYRRLFICVLVSFFLAGVLYSYSSLSLSDFLKYSYYSRPTVIGTKETNYEDFEFKFNPVTNAYEINGKPIIWQYWKTDDIPLYVRLLTESLHCRNPEFRIIVAHESDVYQFLPDLEIPWDVFKILEAPHQADIFRLAILIRYGGVYTDVDVYPLDKLYPLYNLLEDTDLIIGDWGNYEVAFGGMGPTRANVSLFRSWHQLQIDEVTKYFQNGNQNNSVDPFNWTSLLGDIDYPVVKDEIESRRTTWISYKGDVTNNQLIEKDYQHSSHCLWSETSPQFLPLNWSPFLFVWGSKMRGHFANMTLISQLLPEEETLYSAFVGCALLDCWEEYNLLNKSGVKETTTSGLNVSEALENLQRVNRSICDSIRKNTIFELEKYRL